jgi:hypothetical protein
METDSEVKSFLSMELEGGCLEDASADQGVESSLGGSAAGIKRSTASQPGFLRLRGICKPIPRTF